MIYHPVPLNQQVIQAYQITSHGVLCRIYSVNKNDASRLIFPQIHFFSPYATTAVSKTIAAAFTQQIDGTAKYVFLSE